MGGKISFKALILTGLMASLGLTGCGSDEGNRGPADLNYTFKARVDEGLHKQVEVTLRLIGDRDGKTEIILGNENEDEGRHWRRFRHLDVKGDREDRAPKQEDYSYTIYNEPGAPLTLTYTLSSRDAPNPRRDLDFFYYPVIRKSNIVISGFTGLAYPYPDERERSTVSVQWDNLPENWAVVDTVPEARGLYVQELREQVFIAAEKNYLFTDPNKPGLTVFKSGEHPFSVDEFGGRISTLLSAMEELWQEEVSEYLVSLSGLPRRVNYNGYSGIGRFNAFTSAVSDDLSLVFLSQFFSHEISHQWVPDRLGTMPLCSTDSCEPYGYWFTEGMTHFVMSEVMRTSGIWTESDVIDFSNGVLRDYYLSPAKNADGAEIRDWFWEDSDYRQQPYLRGYLMARNWEAEMQARDTSSVMAILREMRDIADGAPVNDPPVLSTRYIANMFTPDLGRNPQVDIESYYLDGDTVDINGDWFPDCAELKVVEVSEYNPGFDIDGAWTKGEVTDVLPDSLAAKAGLEAGMELISVISDGFQDPTKPLILTVKDGKAEKEITFYPASDKKYKVPQFVRIGDCKTD